MENETDTTDAEQAPRTSKQFTLSKVTRRGNNMRSMDALGMKESVTYIESTGTDTLNLEQICVPVDDDNVSWMNLPD